MKSASKFHSVLRIYLESMFAGFLELIFPKSGLVQEIEKMSAAHFASGRLFRGHYPPECSIWSRAILAYRDRYVRAAVWELKYRKNNAVAKIFAELLSDELKKISGNVVIVPIPLSEKRRRERGYNQIELILEQLPKNDRWSVDTNLLRRKHHTTPQTELSRAERLKNLEDCFEVINDGNKTEKIAGKRFVIVDDVMTTGSTLQQAREALRSAGAKEVLAMTLAH